MSSRCHKSAPSLLRSPWTRAGALAQQRRCSASGVQRARAVKPAELAGLMLYLVAWRLDNLQMRTVSNTRTGQTCALRGFGAEIEHNDGEFAFINHLEDLLIPEMRNG